MRGPAPGALGRRPEDETASECGETSCSSSKKFRTKITRFCAKAGGHGRLRQIHPSQQLSIEPGKARHRPRAIGRKCRAGLCPVPLPDV